MEVNLQQDRPLSPQHLPHDLAMYIGESKIPSLKTIGELFVVET